MRENGHGWEHLRHSILLSRIHERVSSMCWGLGVRANTRVFPWVLRDQLITYKEKIVTTCHSNRLEHVALISALPTHAKYCVKTTSLTIYFLLIFMLKHKLTRKYTPVTTYIGSVDSMGFNIQHESWKSNSLSSLDLTKNSSESRFWFVSEKT